jgi:hypothetical protein
MIAAAGIRIVIALLTESLKLRELQFVNPNGAWRVAEGCGIKRRMAVKIGDMDGDRREDRRVPW